MSDARRVYEGMMQYTRNICKTDAQMMTCQVKQYNLDKENENVFRNLIKTDGKYKIEEEMSMHNLELKKQKIFKKNAKQINESHAKQLPKEDPYKSTEWHWKLANLSCVKNPTDKPLSRKKRHIAFLLNENVDLDDISETKCENIVNIFGKIDKKIEDFEKKIRLKYITILSNTNIKTEIETGQGRKGKKKNGGKITHVVDQLAFRFNKWKVFSSTFPSEVLNQITALNNHLITLKLAIWDKNNNKFIPTLTVREYDVSSNSIRSVNQGIKMFDFAMKYKKQLIAIHKKYKSLNNTIIKKNKHKLYVFQLKSMDEKSRAKRHKNKHDNGNDNKNKKKGLPIPDRTKNKPKSKSKKNKKLKPKKPENGGNVIGNYFKPNSNTNINIDDNANSNTNNVDDNDAKELELEYQTPTIKEVRRNKRKSNTMQIQPINKNAKKTRLDWKHIIKHKISDTFGTNPMASIAKQKLLEKLKQSGHDINQINFDNALQQLQNDNFLVLCHSTIHIL